MKSYKKTIYIFFSVFISIMLVTIVFNYKVDSVGIFNKGLNELKQITQYILDKKSLVGLKNYPEREFNKLIIQNTLQIPDVIVLGSSRSMLVRYQFVNNKEKITYLNHSVSGAVLSDLILFISEYKKRGRLPSKIYIGIDPWIFNRENGSLEFNQLVENKNISSSKSNGFKKYLNLINYQYTVENIKFFFKNFNTNDKRFKYQVVDHLADIGDSYALDQYLTHYYPKMSDEKLKQTIEGEKKQILLQNTHYELNGFKKLSNKKTFEELISYLQKDGVNITLFMLPYHPEIYPILINHLHFKNIKLVESYINSLSSKYNMEIIGSFDPSKYNLINGDFTDGIHGKDIVAKKVFKELK